MAILFRPFGFIAPKSLNYLAFQLSILSVTWWKLFQKRVVRTKFDIYVFVSAMEDGRNDGERTIYDQR